MNTSNWRKYQSASALAEASPTAPTEEEMQALWFEQWYQPTLKTDEGETVEIIQPGNWNHGSGPDFFQAAIRRTDGHENGRLAVGTVELHLRAPDWDGHGHHIDPAYNETILHVVWQKPAKKYFPATNEFRHVPQIILGDQLVAPWEMLRPYIAPLMAAQGPLPLARAGRCQKLFERELNAYQQKGGSGMTLEILRAAGAFRLRQKAQRLHWRVNAVGEKQALWEALAEGFGYSQNKIPFRLIAQRLPHARLSRIPRPKRCALIFGLSGLLPATSLASFTPETKLWIQPQWEHWWKSRAAYDYAILPRKQWQLAGLRPWNRPERRLAALAALVPLISPLQKSIEARDPKIFSEILESISDPFWDTHTTFTAGALPKRHHLIGSERIDDLLVNVFWPLVSHRDSVAAESGWRSMTSTANKITELARQRILGGIDLRPHQHETLIQQGLMQIYNDYCVTDASACAECPFLDAIENWGG